MTTEPVDTDFQDLIRYDITGPGTNKRISDNNKITCKKKASEPSGFVLVDEPRSYKGAERYTFEPLGSYMSVQRMVDSEFAPKASDRSSRKSWLWKQPGTVPLSSLVIRRSGCIM